MAAEIIKHARRRLRGLRVSQATGAVIAAPMPAGAPPIALLVTARLRRNITAHRTTARRLPVGVAAHLMVEAPRVVAADPPMGVAAGIPLQAAITAVEGHDLPSAAPARLTRAGAAFFEKAGYAPNN